LSKKDEQKVMTELNNLLYPKIKKEVIIMAQKKKSKLKPAAKKKELKPYQDEKQLRKMYLEEKMTAMDVANKFGVKRGNVLFYIHKFNIPIWSRKKEKKDANRSYRKKEWLEKQLKSGLSIHKIAMICKVSFMQVKNFVIKYDLVALVEKQRLEKAKAAKPVKKQASKKKPKPVKK